MTIDGESKTDPEYDEQYVERYAAGVCFHYSCQVKCTVKQKGKTYFKGKMFEHTMTQALFSLRIRGKACWKRDWSGCTSLNMIFWVLVCAGWKASADDFSVKHCTVVSPNAFSKSVMMLR